MSAPARQSLGRCATRAVIVGAGPIGIELAAALTRAAIDHVIFDSGAIGQTISWWAPQTRWFSSNERIAVAGVPLVTIDQSKATREQYLAYLRGVAIQFDLRVHCYEKVIGVRARSSGFTVVTETSEGTRETDCGEIILATGGTDFPRRLGVEGEDLPHVDGYLREPHRYFGRKVVIIGGRNSAIEAALRLHHAGADVSLSYRGSDLPADGIKYWLLPEIRGLMQSGRITGYLGTRAVRITPSHVVLERVSAEDDGRQPPIRVAAQDVLSLVGYEQDKTLFRICGVNLTDSSRRPIYDEETMETNVPGIYVAGTAVAGTQTSHFKTFLENCHHHVEKIVAHLSGSSPGTSANSPARAYQQEMRMLPES